MQLPSIFKSATHTDIEKWMDDVNTTFLDSNRLFEMMDRSILPAVFRGTSFPPFDIIKTETGYVITLAVAGYTPSGISVEVTADNHLVVTGKMEPNDQGASGYVYKGIAARQFIRKWQLLDHDVVTGSSMKNGMLSIDIKREIPEKTPPRRIEITVE